MEYEYYDTTKWMLLMFIQSPSSVTPRKKTKKKQTKQKNSFNSTKASGVSREL